MYKPLQIPYLLNKAFLEKIKYTERIIPELSDYLICIWEMESYVDTTGSVTNVIVADGCIDLIVDVVDKYIGYGGMSQADFNYELTIPAKYIGFRFKPGAFYALTGLEAIVAMDQFLPLEAIDDHFDRASFFELNFEEMKEFLIDYFIKLAKNAKAIDYIQLFDKINTNNFTSAESLYEFINLGPRQTQRLFKKHYGLTPQMILSIVRFQHCLTELMYEESKKIDPLNNYYDQSHFINDFKKNIGLTPIQFINLNK